MRPIIIEDWGCIPYEEALKKQEELLQSLVRFKLENTDKNTPNDYLILCEHPSVYTLGRNGNLAHLLINKNELREKNIVFHHTNRGGDITFHGPGQIVVYPIIDLEKYKADIHWYIRLLEEAVIRTLAQYALKGSRSKGESGVWIDPDISSKTRKICAVGVRCSRWITMHGIALNVNTDLTYFNNIIPCGIPDKQVTSMQKELGKTLDLPPIKRILTEHFTALLSTF